MVRDVDKIETAIEPRFQELFVEALAIPHASAAFPNLAREVDLPARPAERPRGAAGRAARNAAATRTGRSGSGPA